MERCDLMKMKLNVVTWIEPALQQTHAGAMIRIDVERLCRQHDNIQIDRISQPHTT